MDQSYESLMSASEFRPMLVSPRMTPQLNETICGCRCGCGCGCTGPGGGDDGGVGSDTDTAVESVTSDIDEHLHSEHQRPANDLNNDDHEHTSRGVLSPQALQQVGVWLLGRVERLPFEEVLTGWEEASIGQPPFEGNGGAAESLFNEAPSTRPCSHPVSTRGSVQMGSPGPGIGTWFVSERLWIEHVERVYILTPLRLSAEYQHARGRPAEHLLVPDKAGGQPCV